jgi:hypothetical protein
VHTLADLRSVAYWEFAKAATVPAGQTANMTEIVNEGVSLFYTAARLRPARDVKSMQAPTHEWTFLRPSTTLELWADIAEDSTVTVSGSGTTLTASAATFYASMVGHTITMETFGATTITAYTSSTVVTVADTVTSVSAEMFAMTATGDYSLPSDFGSLLGNPVFSTGEEYRGRLQLRTPDWIRWRRSRGSLETGHPVYYAVEPRSKTVTVGDLSEIMVDPVPSTSSELAYAYRVVPSALSGATDIPYGARMHDNLIVAAVKAAAEIKRHGRAGALATVYDQLLLAAIQRDKGGPRNLGTYDTTDACQWDYPVADDATVTYTTTPT